MNKMSLPYYMPGHVAQSVACLTERTKVPGSIPGSAYSFLDNDHEISSMVIFVLP